VIEFSKSVRQSGTRPEDVDEDEDERQELEGQFKQHEQQAVITRR
jgi:hypothetical protein